VSLPCSGSFYKLVVALFGVSGGLSFFTLTAMLYYRLSLAGVPVCTVGRLSWAAIPYSIRFFWPYLVDAVRIPYLSRTFGQRKSWGLVTHHISIACFLLVGYINPAENLHLLFSIVLISSFAAAVQDIVSETYRFDVVNVLPINASAPSHTFGFRSGKLFACSVVPYFASKIGWFEIHCIISVVKVLALFLLFFLHEPGNAVRGDRQELPSQCVIRRSIITTIVSAFQKKGVWIFLCVFMIMKAIDVVVGPMETSFIGKIGIPPGDYGKFKGGIGGSISLIGVMLAGPFVRRVSLNCGVMLSAIGLSVAGCLSIVLMHLPLDAPCFNTVFAAIAIVQEFCIAFMMTFSAIYTSAFCEKSDSIYYFSLFSSIGSVGRVTLTYMFSELCHVTGWVVIFLLPLGLCVPLFWLLKRDFSKEQKI
jgi:PAT family beta-lactamase induction signal transducer AmpG